MDQCTHEVRAEYWNGIIQACGQRPAGQSAKSWMDENGIREQSYYHWQRKFRQKAYEEMQKNSDAVKALGKGNQKAARPSIAYKALVRIGAIYDLEGALKELSPEERFKERQASIRPLVEEFFA